jgi:diguanylate cyclase (GGDEF)-like protein
LGVISIAFIARLSLNSLIPSVGVLLGASIQFVASSTGDLTALFGVLALAIAGSTAAEMLGQRFRGYGAPPGERAAGTLHGEPERAARHDALTGLLNDHAFLARFRRVLEGRRRSDRCTALLSLDLIDFAAINATLGAAVGDLLLRHASARLLATLRETDILARLGADEFGVIQSDIEHPANAAALCERLLRSFEEPFDLCGHLTRIGARIGVAVFPADGADPDALLEHARQARRRACTDGQDAFHLYDEALDAELRERRALERDLAHALERGQFEIHYQPQIDIASRRMVGVEALLRWNHPERGRVSPDHFIPLAEDSGLIVPIGAWVLEQACAQAVRWHRAGAPLLRVSVNMSPVQFRQPDLAELVGATLERSGLAAGCLELEITERVLMQDTEANLETLRRIKSRGVRISVDDFGVGNSSLSYLRRFPFDEIKVDRSFVGALEHDPSAAAIVRATLSLGRNLGLVSVAEGVESASQLSLLDAEGCCVAQGFYFSPPVHPREIDAMIHAAATAQGSHIEDEDLQRVV